MKDFVEVVVNDGRYYLSVGDGMYRIYLVTINFCLFGKNTINLVNTYFGFTEHVYCNIDNNNHGKSRNHDISIQI